MATTCILSIPWDKGTFREGPFAPRGARGEWGENSLPQSVKEVYRRDGGMFVRSQNWIWGSFGKKERKGKKEKKKKQSYEIGRTGPEQGWMMFLSRSVTVRSETRIFRDSPINIQMPPLDREVCIRNCGICPARSARMKEDL